MKYVGIKNILYCTIRKSFLTAKLCNHFSFLNCTIWKSFFIKKTFELCNLEVSSRLYILKAFFYATNDIEFTIQNTFLYYS